MSVNPDSVSPDGVLRIDAVRHVYNEARAWEASVDGIVFDEVVASTGGVVLPSGIRTDIHVILQPGWKIQPPDNANSILLAGHLHSSDNTDPFTRSPNGHTVPVESTSRTGLRRTQLLWAITTALFIVGIVIILAWVWDSPTEYEPYATLAVVLGSLVQILRSGIPR